MRSQKALILGSDTRSFLTVVRSLGRIGVEVHTGWSARGSFALKSRHIRCCHALPRPPSHGWREALRDLIRHEGFDLVIPCNDPSILPLHEERDFFATLPIYLIDEPIFEQVMDKSHVNSVASSIGIQLPKECLISKVSEIDDIDDFNAPFVIKPTRSFVASHLSKKNHVSITSDRENAKEQIQDALQNTPVLVQEFFQGHGVGVEFLAKNGEILTAFQHERLHEPLNGGGSSYRRSNQLSAELLAATKKLVGAYEYTGVGMAEYRWNPKTQEWIFVELNSRFWGSLPLAVSCGVDFPAYLFEMLCDGRVDFPQNYRQDHACRNWLMDARWLADVVSHNRWSIRSQLALVAQLVAEARYPLLLREHSDVLTWNDPRPGTTEIQELIGAVPKKIRRKLRRSASGNQWLRRRSREKLSRRLRSVKTALFVCKGNICRSPFAAEYARKNLSHLTQIESSGYFPKADRPSPDNAKTAAANFGVSLAGHRSSVLTAEAIEKSDIVLVFDEENLEELNRYHRSARSKTHLLGWLSDQRDVEIADPYGGSVDDFCETYSTIASAIDALHP